TAIYLRARSLSAAQTVPDRQVTRPLHRSYLNPCCPRKTNECRNTRQTNESDSHAQSCAAHLSSCSGLRGALIPTPHEARQRSAGNRCIDNRQKQKADSSTRIVPRRKRTHQ